MARGALTLREATAADIPALYAFQSDPEANRLAGFVPRGRPDFVKHWRRILKDESVEKRMILLGGEAAGYLVCFVRHRPDREVGYWIGREHWGKGVATRALKAFLREYKVRPLYARVAKHNAASLRVVKKNGFAVIGEDKFSNAAGERYEEFVLRLEGGARA